MTVIFNANDSDETGAGWKAMISTTSTPPNGNHLKYNTCEMAFTDSGGKTQPYSKNEFKVYTFCPSSQNAKTYTKLIFSKIELASGDQLSIYDGTDFSSLIKSGISNSDSFIASERSNGCLTVVFTSDNDSNGNGWEALVSCSINADNKEKLIDSNPEPSNSCKTAPLIENYGVFKGVISSKYSAKVYGDLASNYCGIINNNSFFRFISNGKPLKLEYGISGGLLKNCKGVQISILNANGECDLSSTRWDNIKCITIESLSLKHLIEVPNLIKGQEYFIMIDGAYASTCEYQLIPIEGIKGIQTVFQKEKIICSEDGSYFVEIPINTINDDNKYRVAEKNNYFKEFKDFVFVNDGKIKTIKYGPYSFNRSYHIIITNEQDANLGKIEIVGIPSCPKPVCKMNVEVSTTCYEYSDSTTVKIKLNNSILPLSISGVDYNNVFFPDSSKKEYITFNINKSIFKKGFDVIITDANLCSNERKLEAPVCENCPEDFLLFPNPTDNNEITLSYPCENFSVDIFDAKGQQVINNPRMIRKKTTQYSIYIPEIAVGNYILRLRAGKITVAKKFIKL